MIVVAIAVAGAWTGSGYRDAYIAWNSWAAYFAQDSLGAGVTLACGLGFTDPGSAPTSSPTLREFLVTRTRDSITCADLPPNIPPDSPNWTQGLYRYMMTAIALGVDPLRPDLVERPDATVRAGVRD